MEEKPMDMNDIPEVVTERRAAEILTNKVQTLRNYRHLGKGPAYLKLGRNVRYRVDDLIAYLKKNRIDPESAS
jgi:hypothetical protein